MKEVGIYLLSLMLLFQVNASAQSSDALMKQIKEMAQETDPEKSLAMMKDIIRKNDLREKKDAEVLDMMKGNLAMDYLEVENYTAFDRTIASIRNKFNQTSYINMAATNLVNEKKDLKKAEALAKKTLDLFLSFTLQSFFSGHEPTYEAAPRSEVSLHRHTGKTGRRGGSGKRIYYPKQLSISCADGSTGRR